MPNEDNKILKYNHGEKSLKAPYYNPYDTESLIEKMPFHPNNPEKSYTEREAKHISLGYGCRLICCNKKQTQLWQRGGQY